ncbi:DNA-binding IclR family transcriptional regulator [Pseudomonas laurylsulfatiphila]|uniref:hypothetical protein n=1 Tax=Pseudomonas laurylsulfatiphila TaxID=2011015 RepID=UPI003D1DEA8C
MVFRHLKTLVERGYLSQNPQTSKYRLGIQAYVLGQVAASGIDLLSASADAIRDLRDELGLTVVLSVLQARRLMVATVQNISRELDPEQVRALKKAALRASWNLGFKGEF